MKNMKDMIWHLKSFSGLEMMGTSFPSFPYNETTSIFGTLNKWQMTDKKNTAVKYRGTHTPFVGTFKKEL